MKTVIAKTNKGHRIWLQGLNDKFGWPVGARYDVTYADNGGMLIALNPTGKRKVAAGKGGIIDLEGKKVTRWANGATEVRIVSNATKDKLLISTEV